MSEHITDEGEEIRTHRRRILRGTAGMAAVLSGFAAMSGPQVNAQESTPAATDEEDAVFLFVQAGFTSGTLVQATEGVQSGLLQLEGAPDHTLYFSDRPDRIVGAVSTQRFVDEFDFSPDNPPNAALVIQHDDQSEIVFLTQTEPRYDPETRQLAYVTTILDTSSLPETSFEVSGEIHTVESHPTEFGSASLFIDSSKWCCSLRC